jgi:hypothetical protein
MNKISGVLSCLNFDIIIEFKINNLDKKRLATPCIINGWFSPT